MLRIFCVGIFWLIACVCQAQEVSSPPVCIDDLASGELAMKGENIISCLAAISEHHQAVTADLEMRLGDKIDSGDTTTAATTTSQIEALNPDNANEVLTKNFDRLGALSQIQAQASCSAISHANGEFNKYIRAVIRPSINESGIPAHRRGILTCDQVCSGVEPVSSERPTAACFASLHIYPAQRPLLASEDDFQPVGNQVVFSAQPTAGLMTYVYEPKNGCSQQTGFGPNYCCCAN